MINATFLQTKSPISLPAAHRCQFSCAASPSPSYHLGAPRGTGSMAGHTQTTAGSPSGGHAALAASWPLQITSSALLEKTSTHRAVLELCPWETFVPEAEKKIASTATFLLLLSSLCQMFLDELSFQQQDYVLM